MNSQDETLTSLDRAIAENPNSFKALAHRGEIYRQRKSYREAVADFTRAIDLKPDYAWALAHRGVTYRRLMRYREALTDLNRAIDLKPHYAWARAYRAVVYVIMGRYRDAVEEYDRACALDRTIASKWGNERGFPLTLLGRYAEATECYRQAWEQRPDDPLAPYCIAVTKKLWQGLTAAKAEIDKARAILMSAAHPDSPGAALYGRDAALYGLGGLAAVEGDSEQAFNYLRQAICLEYDLNVEMARLDPAWHYFRTHPQFQALIAYSGSGDSI